MFILLNIILNFLIDINGFFIILLKKKFEFLKIFKKVLNYNYVIKTIF